MDCWSCGTINPAGKRFCGKCGAALVLRCPACGCDSPGGMNFCGDCGAALSAKGSAAADRPAHLRTARPEAERRHLTVMFCDLVDSTALAAKLDPEDLAEVIRRFQATCVAAIEHGGGHVARFMGDGILAYFGYPQASEYDAERGVRAGLDLVAKISQLLLPSSEPLALRVGIATGLVFVGETVEGQAQEQAAVGITPNLAARLQSVAQPNAVLVAESTRRLLGRAFATEAVRSYALKGFPEPVLAWRVIGERLVETRFDAQHAGSLTRFVGRQHEIHELMELWQRAKGGAGQVALLCGEAGIGKSRISRILQESTGEGVHVRIRYQCSPYHANSPLHPVINQLEHAAGIEGTDGPAARLAKLEAVLALAGAAMLADISLYAALLAIPTGAPPAELSPQRQKDLTIESLIRQLIGLSQTQPVLVVVEDVHWIDPTTLELINRSIRTIRSAPVLFLLTFRPHFLPPWLEQSHVTMLRLDRLSRDHASAMILDVAGGKPVPPEVAEQIISKTDGVPLFVEELTKTVLESGLLQDTGDRYVIGGPLPPFAIPTTLYDSLVARLDRLAPIKEIAQIGAVLGREFSYRMIAAVAPASSAFLQTALAQLTAAELIFERGERPDSIYTFKHALVQDAAYESLLRSKRQQLHSQIAGVLEAQFPETIERQPELMAHHLIHAGLNEPAIEYLRKAGQQSIQRSANIEAAGHLKHALDIVQSLPDTPARSRRGLELQAMLGQAMIAGRGYAAAETRDVLLRARSLIEETTSSAQKLAILYGLWASYYVGGEVARQRGAAEDFLAEATRHDDGAALCLAHRMLGTTFITMGDFGAARAQLEQARALYDPQLHASVRYQYGQDIGAAALGYLSWALWHLGAVDEAARVADAAVTLAEASSHPHTLVYTLCHARGILDLCRRRTDGMRSYAGAVVAISSEHGFPFWAACGRVLDGWAAAGEGDAEQGIALMAEGLAAWRGTGSRLWLPTFLALQAQAHAQAGRGEAALQAIEQAIVMSDETGERWALAEVLRLKAALLQAAGAGADAVETPLREGLQIARQQQARSWELRIACDLARLWRQQGRSQEAAALLQPIYARFTEGFDTGDLQDAKAVLVQLKQQPA